MDAKVAELFYTEDLVSTSKVLVSAACGKGAQYPHFYDCFYAQEVTRESRKQRFESGSVPQNLNMIVDTALEGGYTHIFHAEDDSSFAPYTVKNLLKHNVPVVAGLCRSRQFPYRPYIYSGHNDTDGIEWFDLKPEHKGLIGPTHGVKGVGMGGILINVDIFKKLSRPYFHHFFKGEKEWGQDINFQISLMKAGIDVYCDLDINIWHNTSCTIGTERDEDGTLVIIFRVSGHNIRVPQTY